jgi:hypothetical protein
MAAVLNEADLRRALDGVGVENWDTLALTPPAGIWFSSVRGLRKWVAATHGAIIVASGNGLQAPEDRTPTVTMERNGADVVTHFFGCRVGATMAGRPYTALLLSFGALEFVSRIKYFPFNDLVDCFFHPPGDYVDRVSDERVGGSLDAIQESHLAVPDATDEQLIALSSTANVVQEVITVAYIYSLYPYMRQWIRTHYDVMAYQDFVLANAIANQGVVPGTSAEKDRHFRAFSIIFLLGPALSTNTKLSGQLNNT